MVQLPVAVPTLLYWPRVATPAPVQVIEDPGVRDVLPWQSIITPLSSTTVMPVRSTVPVLATAYDQVTGAPTRIEGPGASSASWPFVDFSMSIPGPTALQPPSNTLNGCPGTGSPTLP